MICRRKILMPILCFYLSLTGCAESSIVDPPLTEPENQTFKESYDEVWRAIQLTVRKYPVRLNNIESGILETDYITHQKLFAPPVEDAKTTRGNRYRIVIRAIRGRLDNKNAVKVICTKLPEVQMDFFTGFQPSTSNGLEERVILYRIGRYLDMERLLQKAGGGS